MSRHAVDLHGMPCLIAGPVPVATPKAIMVIIIACRMTWHLSGLLVLLSCCCRGLWPVLSGTTCSQVLCSTAT